MASFRDALLRHMAQRDTTIADLSRGSGVSPDVIKKVRTRPNASTKAEEAVRIAAFFGKTVDQFIKNEEVSKDQQLMLLVELLSPDEQMLLEAQIRAMISIRDRR
jgi:hypothetical protein